MLNPHFFGHTVWCFLSNKVFVAIYAFVSSAICFALILCFVNKLMLCINGSTYLTYLKFRWRQEQILKDNPVVSIIIFPWPSRNIHPHYSMSFRSIHPYNMSFRSIHPHYSMSILLTIALLSIGVPTIFHYNLMGNF